MSGRQLSDSEAVELVELLCVAAELCRTAEHFVSVALKHVGGLGSGTAELDHDVARLAALLSRASR